MQTELVEYQADHAKLEGFLVYDASIKNKRPAIIIAHAWGGRDGFVEEKACELAQLGYVAFALDVYGKGARGHSVEENSKLMTPFMQDRNLLAKRLTAGFDVVRGLAVVEKNKIAAIGYCFGGLCALDMARIGLPLAGVVSFHALLHAADHLQAKAIHAKILAYHGYLDPMATPEQVRGFEAEMSAAKADWQFHIFGNALHAFTNPMAQDQKLGTVYQPIAAKRAWQGMLNFFDEIFAD